MYLVYINPLGRNYKSEFIYEFIFSDTTIIEFGEDWETEPASSGSLTPPPLKYIKKVEILQTDNLEIDLAINSDNFAYSDAVEDIIAIGWESVTPVDERRLVFHFGDKMDDITEKLYSRDFAFKK